MAHHPSQSQSQSRPQSQTLTLKRVTLAAAARRGPSLRGCAPAVETAKPFAARRGTSPPPPPSPRLTGHAAAAAARGPPSPRVFTAPHHSFTVSRSSPLSAAIVCGDLVICKLPIERACFAACVCTSPKVKKLL